ncbi:MAG: hypothetical protein ABFD66_04900 [Smithella sp.]
MKQAGVVTIVSLVKEFLQTGICVLAVAQRSQNSVILDAPIFGNAQKDDAVNGALDAIV